VLGGRGGGLLDLGNPAAWRWLVDTYDRILTSQGIDFYRQDFNMDPLPYWRANDAEDRQGITENRHVQGYLALWDELVQRRPGLMIDSCASGGHRNDLETLRRAVPLLRSDFIFDPVGEQCHTYGIASWIPYWGTGFIDFDRYIARGCYGMNMTLGMDARRKDLDWALLRRICAEWRAVVHCFEGDYYPLTPYSVAEDQWIGWQFHRPDLGEGIVQVFRRGKSVYESVRLQLRGLDPKATYVVTDQDEGKPRRMTGKALGKPGLLVKIASQPGSALVRYRVAK
jgi:alpha-galactosidase